MLESSDTQEHLNWFNVIYSCAFLIIPITLSVLFQLGISKDLFLSGVRCVLQLHMMGAVLDQVLGSNNPVYVVFLSFGLILLASFEIVFSKTKRRFSFMLPFVFISLVISTLTISLTGHLFAIQEVPFWTPAKFIPTTGMLIGNSMSAIAVGVNYCLKELSDDATRLECYLSFGASRAEAFRPILKQALKAALLPTINAMSITGLISIPGMMAGQIIGGASVSDAVKYQSIILFMITSASALSVLSSCYVSIIYFFYKKFLFIICLDTKHRLRSNRIYQSGSWMNRFSKQESRSLTPTASTHLLASSQNCVSYSSH